MADGAQKEAQVKLRLDSSEYVVELKRIGDMNEKVAETSRKGFTRMGRGIEAVKKEVGLLKGRFGDLLKAQIAMASAMAFGGIIGKVVSLKSNMIGLQNEIERATGETMDLAEMQGKFERAASKTGRTTQEMVDAYSRLKDIDLGFAEDQMELVATAASATKSEVADMARLAVDLKQKFGLANDEMADGMTQVINTASRAGISAFELSDELGSIASAGQAAGLKGAEGMNVLLAILSQVRPKVKDIAEAGQGIEQTFERLSDPGFFDRLEKVGGTKLKINLDEDNLTARLRKVLAGGEKIRAELFASTTGREELAALKALSDPFTEAMRKAQRAGASLEEATTEGLKAYDEALFRAARSTSNFAKLQEQAERQNKSPEAKLRQSLEKIQQAFQRPEIIKAIEQVAAALPKLAEHLGNFIEFAGKFPLLTGAGIVGGKMGMTYAQGAAQGSAAGNLLSGSASAAAGNLISESAGKKMAGTFLERMTAGSAWQAAGRVFAVAAAALIGSQIGAEIGKHFAEKETDKHRGATGFELSALNVKSMSESELKQKSTEAKQALKERKEDPATNLDHWIDTAGRALGLMDKDDPTVQQRYEQDILKIQKAKATFDVELHKRKERSSDPERKEEPRASVEKQKGPSEVEIKNLNMLAHHMGQGIQQKELRVRVTNLPAAGFDTGDGSRGPPRPGSPTPAGGTGGV